MTTPIRRSDRLLDDETALSLIDQCDYAVVSCFDDIGKIFSIPLSVARCGRKIYIHGAKAGSKERLYRNGRMVEIVCVAHNQTPQMKANAFATIADNPKALANQIFTTKYRSTICTANAYLVENKEEKELGLRLLCEKYCAKYMSAFDITSQAYLDKINIYRFDIVQITAKSNENNI